jgi:hypothetical protein
MKSERHSTINSLDELRLHQEATRLKIRDKEQQIRMKMQEMPGELFYSGMDSVIPNFLSGKVSSMALSAGKGVINHFFVKKALSQGGPAILKLAKPSGLVRKISSVVSAIARKRKK